MLSTEIYRVLISLRNLSKILDAEPSFEQLVVETISATRGTSQLFQKFARSK